MWIPLAGADLASQLGCYAGNRIVALGWTLRAWNGTHRRAEHLQDQSLLRPARLGGLCDATRTYVVTSALVANHGAPESGFMAAITIESVLQLLHENGIYPGNNRLTVKAFASELIEEVEFLKKG